MKGHTPLSRQRSDWAEFERGSISGFDNVWYQRNVGDGELTACVGLEPQGWHLSISFRNHRGLNTRYPSFDEQVHAVRELMPADLTYVMILPPDGDEYVSLHMTTFHWHELTEHTWRQK